MVWAHCGASYRTEKGNYHDLIKEMPSKYSNLHEDISWIVYDEIICDQNGPKEDWISIIIQYADRFMIGSDLTGYFDNLKDKIHRYMPLLELLPQEVADQLAWRNAERIWCKGYC